MYRAYHTYAGLCIITAYDGEWHYDTRILLHESSILIDTSVDYGGNMIQLYTVSKVFRNGKIREGSAL